MKIRCIGATLGRNSLWKRAVILDRQDDGELRPYKAMISYGRQHVRELDFGSQGVPMINNRVGPCLVIPCVDLDATASITKAADVSLGARFRPHLVAKQIGVVGARNEVVRKRHVHIVVDLLGLRMIRAQNRINKYVQRQRWPTGAGIFICGELWEHVVVLLSC